jgi:hypothetical protein
MNAQAGRVVTDRSSIVFQEVLEVLVALLLVLLLEKLFWVTPITSAATSIAPVMAITVVFVTSSCAAFVPAGLPGGSGV